MMTKSDIIRNEKTHFEFEVRTRNYDKHECGIAFIQFIKRTKQAILQVSNIEYQGITDMNTKTYTDWGLM